MHRPNHPRRATSRCASIRRHALCALLASLPFTTAAQDAAYVDSPAGRAMSDPARADGGSVAPGTVFLRPGSSSGGMDPAMQMQIQMLGMAVANSRRQEAQEAAAAAAGSGGGTDGVDGTPSQGAGMGMPGGGAMGSGMGMGGPGDGMPPGATGSGQAPRTQSPMQQIGSGVMQDIGSAADAGLRERIYGNNAVFVPATAQDPPSDGGW